MKTKALILVMLLCGLCSVWAMDQKTTSQYIQTDVQWLAQQLEDGLDPNKWIESEPLLHRFYSKYRFYQKRLQTPEMREQQRACIDLLLKRGANVNARDASGKTLLHRAVGNLDLELVRLLVHRADLDVNIATPSNAYIPGTIALHDLCTSIPTDNQPLLVAIAELLLDHPSCDPNLVNQFGYTSLYYAMNSALQPKDFDDCLLRVFLVRSDRVNLNQTVQNGDTPLLQLVRNVMRYHRYATSHKAAIFASFVMRGALTNIPGQDGETVDQFLAQNPPKAKGLRKYLPAEPMS